MRMNLLYNRVIRAFIGVPKKRSFNGHQKIMGIF